MVSSDGTAATAAVAVDRGRRVLRDMDRRRVVVMILEAIFGLWELESCLEDEDEMVEIRVRRW